MRPRGEIRELLLSSLAQLTEVHDGEVCHQAVTCRQLAAQTQVGYKVARDTLYNMRAAGEVKIVGRAREDRHWHSLYELADPDEAAPQPWGGIEALAGAMHAIASSSA